MGYATIANTLGEGRYRIKLDTGEARRVALLAAVNAALAQVGAKLNDAHAQVVIADEQEAETRANIAALIDVIAASGDEAAVGLATRVLEILQPQYAKQVAQNQVVRQQYAALKNTQADLLRQRAQWEALQTITYREAWCADYTPSTSTQYVATIDIPGDSNLVLLAPGCRAWRGGDGTISSARKAAALSRRATQLVSAGKQLAAIEASLTTARAEEAVLVQQTNDAQAAYVATPTDANYAAFAAKAAELAEKRHESANLMLSKQVVTTTITRLNQEIAFWSARAASEAPDYGDGVMLSRELTSPAQAFFNAAIFPGWQKWTPTYRWGTASDVSDETNTMTVTLGAATSSAQGLNVNESTVLYNVPITYMGCDSWAFWDGDRVVVEFERQSQMSPRVIGFLDNPRECVSWPDVDFEVGYSTEVGPSPGVTSTWIAPRGNGTHPCASGPAGGVTTIDLESAPTAYHKVETFAPELGPGALFFDPLASVTCSVSPGTIWEGFSDSWGATLPTSDTSTGTGLRPAADYQVLRCGTVPSDPTETITDYNGDTEIVVRSIVCATIMYTGPYDWDGPFCGVIEERTGRTVVHPEPIVYHDVIPRQNIGVWLASVLGGMPDIQVTYKGRKRQYKFSSESSGFGSGPDAHRWSLKFIAGRRLQ